MAKLRVFFYGLIAFAKKGDKATAVLLEDNHHESYVAFNGDCLSTSTCPPDIDLDCARLPGWCPLNKVDIALSYTADMGTVSSATPPTSNLPNGAAQARHSRWTPHIDDVVFAHGGVDWDLINQWGSGNTKIAARMALDFVSFSNLRTCRLVEHEDCEEPGKVIHAFEFSSTGRTHSQALGEVVVLEDNFRGPVTLTLAGGISASVQLQAHAGEPLDIFISNIFRHPVGNQCRDREKGDHFKSYFGLMKSVSAQPDPIILKPQRVPTIATACEAVVLCSQERVAQERHEADRRRDFDPAEMVRVNIFEKFFESPNSRPVCPMIIVEDP